MDVKPRFIKEAGYDIAEEFVETLQQLDIRTGIKIAKFIERQYTYKQSYFYGNRRGGYR